MVDGYLEIGSKRVFACASDWPGWCRSGKDEASAIQAMQAYAERYASVARAAKLRFPARSAEVRIVERVSGDASTDFGVPAKATKHDVRPVSRPEAARLSSLLAAAWDVYDRVIARAPATLRKGPRGGGRDRDAIADHVLAAEGAYVRKLGLRLAPPHRDDRESLREFRTSIVDVLRKPSAGAPLVEKGWPQRYAARRIAWHVLDHAWEIEDRSPPRPD
jgi:hypothetical protein